MKTILIYGKQFKNKETGKPFVSYTFINAKGKKYSVKFKKELETKPTKTGYYDLTINEDNYGLDNNTKPYSTIWVREIINLTKNEEKDAQAKEKREQALKDALETLEE